MVPSYAQEQLNHIKQKEDNVARPGTIEVPIKVVSQDSKTFSDYKPLSAYQRFEAPLTPSDTKLQRLHQEMIAITKRLLSMWVDKVRGYGASRYDRHALDFDAWMCFGDVHRKYIRMEQLTRAVASGDESAMEPLIDAYADMALYCVSNIEILEGREDV